MSQVDTGTAMVVLAWTMVSLPQTAVAQNPLDEPMEAIRTKNSFSRTDQGILSDWVGWEITELTKASMKPAVFRAHFAQMRTRPPSSTAFVAELAQQAGAAAVKVFGQAERALPIPVAVARVLYEFNHPATVDGMLAGLTTEWSAVRFLCAKGIFAVRVSLSADAGRAEAVAQAVIGAAGVEKDPTVLAWLYRATALPGRASDANLFAGLMKVFDARLALIRGGAVVVDGADLEAFDYLRTEMAQLLQPQKEQLVARLAVFLRHATQRYLAGELRFQERVYVERTLESIEWMLEAITGNAGSLRSAMEQGGHEKPSVRDAVRAGASAWFGDEQAGGILNSTPWNIKRGAP